MREKGEDVFTAFLFLTRSTVRRIKGVAGMTKSKIKISGALNPMVNV